MSGKQVSIGSIIVNVLAKTAGFSLAGPRKEISAFQSAVGGLSKTKAIIGGALAAVGVGFGAAKIVADIRAVTDALGDVNDFASRIGIATDKLMGLQYGAKFVGVSADQTNAALQTMTRQIGEAIHGGGKAKDVFKAMGVNLSDLARMKPEEAFMRIARGINDITSEEEQLRATLRIFGTDGAAMLNFIRQGEQGIAKFIKEAKQIGVAIGQEDISKVDELGDALDKLSSVWQGFANSIVIDIAPAATDAVKALEEVLEGTRLIASSPRSWAGYVATKAWNASGIGAAYDAQAFMTDKFNRWYMSNGVAMSAPAMQPHERKAFIGGEEASDQYNKARDEWFKATAMWEKKSGIEQGYGYIQNKIPIPDYLKDLAAKTRKAMEDSTLERLVGPNSNLGWWKLGEQKVKDASEALVEGLKLAGDALEPFKEMGKESYYQMMMDKLWPKNANAAKGSDSGSRSNTLLDASTAEGYAALRANLHNNPTIAIAKKQVSLLDQIAANTHKFAVATSGL